MARSPRAIMAIQEALGLAFRITIFAIVLASGLQTTTTDLAYLARRPGLLVRSLFAMVVVAPLVALLLWRTLPIGAPAAIAIVAGALAPGLPTVPKTERKIGGNVAFACSLMLVTGVLGALTVPLWLTLLSRFAGIDASVPPEAIARMLVLGLVFPLVLGVVLRRLAPSVAARIAGPVGALTNVLTPVLAVIVLVLGAAAIMRLGWAALLAMTLAPVIALVVGHVLGGPEPRDRTVLAIANAGRFPALAVLVATTSFPGIPALPAVIAYVVLANLITLPYGLWRKHAHGEQPEQPSAAPVAPLPAAAPANGVAISRPT